MTWHTHHVVIVPMKLCVLFCFHVLSIPFIQSLYYLPYFCLSPVNFCLLLVEIYIQNYKLFQYAGEIYLRFQLRYYSMFTVSNSPRPLLVFQSHFLSPFCACMCASSHEVKSSMSLHGVTIRGLYATLN